MTEQTGPYPVIGRIAQWDGEAQRRRPTDARRVRSSLLSSGRSPRTQRLDCLCTETADLVSNQPHSDAACHAQRPSTAKSSRCEYALTFPNDTRVIVLLSESADAARAEASAAGAEVVLLRPVLPDVLPAYATD